MDSVHNPDRYVADLRQILSQGRKRIGLLVGAGAPLSVRVDHDGRLAAAGRPLIPGIDELTNLVASGLTDARFRTAIAEMRNGPRPPANIEAILSLVRLRAAALGSSISHGLDGDGYRDLGAAICEFIGNATNARLPVAHNAYDEIISWVSGTLRSHAVEIFTTNYDLLFEEAFERAGVPFFDGFSGSQKPFFDAATVANDGLPSRWGRVWKLHGSLGWVLDDGAVVRGRKGEAQLIYPDYLKYELTQKQPYTALFERLKNFLQTPDTLLLAIGASFRDAHISKVLEDALAANANAAIFAFQFGTLAQESSAVGLASSRPNFSVYAADGAVINGIPGGWRPGEMPKNWEEIRRSFWRVATPDTPQRFTLGDFAEFARFCALTQATEFKAQDTAVVPTAIPPEPDV